jgi:hypothetical protein
MPSSERSDPTLVLHSSKLSATSLAFNGLAQEDGGNKPIISLGERLGISASSQALPAKYFNTSIP